jgi:hypothetical protein
MPLFNNSPVNLAYGDASVRVNGANSTEEALNQTLPTIETGNGDAPVSSNNQFQPQPNSKTSTSSISEWIKGNYTEKPTIIKPINPNNINNSSVISHSNVTPGSTPATNNNVSRTSHKKVFSNFKIQENKEKIDALEALKMLDLTNIIRKEEIQFDIVLLLTYCRSNMDFGSTQNTILNNFKKHITTLSKSNFGFKDKDKQKIKIKEAMEKVVELFKHDKQLFESKQKRKQNQNNENKRSKAMFKTIEQQTEAEENAEAEAESKKAKAQAKTIEAEAKRIENEKTSIRANSKIKLNKQFAQLARNDPNALYKQALARVKNSDNTKQHKPKPASISSRFTNGWKRITGRRGGRMKTKNKRRPNKRTRKYFN